MSVQELVPPSPVVRAELARAVRETGRLRELLRVAIRSEKDREFLEGLSGRRSEEAGQCLTV